MTRPYTLTDEQRKRFAGVYVLEYMINRPSSFELMLRDNDSDLEPILEWLLVKEYIEIKDDEKYVPNEKGRLVLKSFLGRYSEYLNIFDIYCAVDLESGEFAFSTYFDYQDEAQWRDFLHEQRWEDLRIAVAEFKNVDPIEIVFMSFIRENRFGRDHTGWQFDLLLGSVWDEIIEICNTALTWEDLSYEDEQGKVSGKSVIQDVIIQGAQLIAELHKQEAALNVPIDHDDAGSSASGSEGDEGDSEGDNEQYVERVVYEEYPVF